MARIRTVKPDLFRHEELFELEQESLLPIRIAFIGLFTVCDREGRFKWKPRQLKLDVLPYDEIDFSRVLDALNDRDFIIKYEYEGEIYGCIPSFSQHQVINNKEKESELPDVDVSTVLTRQSRVDNATVTPLNQEQVEREGEKEGKGKGKGREVSLSGKPDEVEILENLNSITGHEYKPVDSNLKLIRARINEGHSKEDIIAVVLMKFEEWDGTKQEQYLRPKTLFSAENFNQYVGVLATWRKEKSSEYDWLGEPSGDSDVIEGEYSHG